DVQPSGLRGGALFDRLAEVRHQLLSNIARGLEVPALDGLGQRASEFANLEEAIVGAFAFETVGELGHGIDVAGVDGGESDADFTLLLSEENSAHSFEAFLLD